MKNILAACSILLSMAAVYVFLTKEDSKIEVTAALDVPKIKIEDYEFYRVREDFVVSRLIGKEAALMEGGLIRLRNGFVGVRVRDDVREEIRAKGADIDMALNEAGQMAEATTVKHARIFSEVEIFVKDSRISNEEMEFTESTRTIKSVKPVKIEQQGQYVIGDAGFTYLVDQEKLSMTGGVSGMVEPTIAQDVKRQGTSP